MSASGVHLRAEPPRWVHEGVFEIAPLSRTVYCLMLSRCHIAIYLYFDLFMRDHERVCSLFMRCHATIDSHHVCMCIVPCRKRDVHMCMSAYTFECAISLSADFAWMH